MLANGCKKTQLAQARQALGQPARTRGRRSRPRPSWPAWRASAPTPVRIATGRCMWPPRCPGPGTCRPRATTGHARHVPGHHRDRLSCHANSPLRHPSSAPPPRCAGCVRAAIVRPIGIAVARAPIAVRNSPQRAQTSPRRALRQPRLDHNGLKQRLGAIQSPWPIDRTHGQARRMVQFNTVYLPRSTTARCSAFAARQINASC